ncbi:DUF2911 domain-containing protein [bacterium]|nr:DUF2911 domain-containing protein [bacterium]MCI0605420.1 DUF2911 domain-containing protein [bacterium]
MRRYFILFVTVLLLCYSGSVHAQFGGITVPPSGDNQRSIVTQSIGPVSITIDYSSPNVHAPDGSDRRGKIWGTLVPWGMVNLGFGTCGDQCPWRGGANENTVFKTSHTVKIQDQALPAGSYGLHFLPGEQEWTIIFSKNYTSWGSFTYDAKEDALRVKAKPEKSEYHEWLTYDFVDRETDHATVALKWEDLQVPFKITVENIDALYVAKIEEELRDSAGFTWQNWDSAAQYTLQSKKHLDKGLQWAQNAVSFPFIGQENFTTLMTLGQLQEANGQTAEAQKSIDKALSHRTAGPVEIHSYARGLQQLKKTQEAIKIFEMNAKKFPNVWPTEVGLMRAHSAKGNYKEALKHAKIALAQAPDDLNRKNLENMIKTLEQGKDVN